jgi:hypothetical protein
MLEKDQKKDKKSILTMDCNRRDFLRGSAAVAAGLAMGGVFKSYADTPRPAAQPAPNPLLLELEEIALNFCRSPANNMGLPTPEPLWDEPIYGIASGADPLWMVFKETAVGSHHWTPREAFLLGFPEETAVMPEDLSVLVWVLPQTRATREENRRGTLYPGERWVRARWPGEDLNIALRNHMVNELAKRGIQAVAPNRLPDFRIRSPANPAPGPAWSQFSCSFSERHAAYAAGLGTFGLSDGLITKVGKAHRVGAVVLRAKLTPTPRPYSHHREYCLFYKDGSCDICAHRCPVNSVRVDGRDKEPCQEQLLFTSIPFAMETWGLNQHGCGLCQVGVPCEAGIPPGIV